MNWLEDAINIYNEQEGFDEEKKYTLSIDSVDSIPASFEGIKRLLISHKFEDDPMSILPEILRKATELEVLHVSGAHQLAWSDICSLPLDGVRKLSVSIVGSASGATMVAPELTDLCVFGRADLTPLEIMINPMPHIDFSRMPNIKRLELRHFQQVDPHDFQDLSRLKYLFISEANITDLTWLTDTSYSLDTLIIDGGLESCAGVEAHHDLQTLVLYHGYFTDISPIESLHKLKKLDLQYNNLSDEGNLRLLGIDELIITRRDHDLHWIRGRVDDMIRWAVIRLRGQNRQNPDELPELRRKYFLRSINRPFEDRIKSLIQSEFDNRIRRAREEDRPIGVQMSKEEYVALFTQMAQEYCPFLAAES